MDEISAKTNYQQQSIVSVLRLLDAIAEQSASMRVGNMEMTSDALITTLHFSASRAPIRLPILVDQVASHRTSLKAFGAALTALALEWEGQSTSVTSLLKQPHISRGTSQKSSPSPTTLAWMAEHLSSLLCRVDLESGQSHYQLLLKLSTLHTALSTLLATVTFLPHSQSVIVSSPSAPTCGAFFVPSSSEMKSNPK